MPSPALLLLGIAVAVGLGLKKTPSRPPADCSEVKEGKGVIAGIRYRETVRGADPSTPMPMIVSFHGRGAVPQGANVFPNIEGPIRIIRPAGFHRTRHGGYNWMTTSSKNHPEGFAAEMKLRGGELAAFLDGLMQCHPTIGRPVVTGASAGGHMSYLLASQYPELVQGAVALIGYLPPPLWNSNMARTIGLHGVNDTVVPYGRTRRFWDEMERQGAPMSTASFDSGHSTGGAIGESWKAMVKVFVEELR